MKSSLIDYRKHLRNWNKGDPCNSSWTGVLCFGSVGTDGYLHIRELYAFSFQNFSLAVQLLIPQELSGLTHLM